VPISQYIQMIIIKIHILLFKDAVLNILQKKIKEGLKLIKFIL